MGVDTGRHDVRAVFAPAIRFEEVCVLYVYVCICLYESYLPYGSVVKCPVVYAIGRGFNPVHCRILLNQLFGFRL